MGSSAQERNAFRLGLFVLSGIFLFIAALFFLKLGDFFEDRAHVVTLFSESVQGLAEGSAVKYKGVPVGQVTGITIQVNDKLVRVDMEVDLSAFIEIGPEQHQKTEDLRKFYQFMSEECSLGLRSRLEYAGITGLKYVEFDYFDPAGEFEVIEEPQYLKDNKNTFYLPATPSMFVNMISSVTNSLSRISQIDFLGISQEIKSSLNEASAFLAAPELQRILDRVEAVAINLENTTGAVSRAITEEKLNVMLEHLHSSGKELRELIANINTQVNQADLPATTLSFRVAAGELEQAGSAAGSTVDEVRNSLEKLNRALDAITELTEYLERDPSALLYGKQQEPLNF